MIDIYVLNTDFQVVGVIDVFESFIWTDRFNSYGDCELYTAFDPKLIQLCVQGYYFYINQSEHLMIIEGLEIESSAENGNKLRITGRSLESILDRRIVWEQTTIVADTPFQDAVEKLISDALLDPQPYTIKNNVKVRNANQTAISNNRKMTNFVFERTDDSYIAGLSVEKVQYTGDNLYDILTAMFEDVNNTVGYRIFLNDEGQFVFKLYSGTDRSYSQEEYVLTNDKVMQQDKTYYELISGEYVVTQDVSFQKNKKYYEHRDIVPFVVFSNQFDNVINTNYLDSTEGMKNVTLVAGEGTGGARKTLIVGTDETSANAIKGLERRELYTDARDLRQADYKGNNYNLALQTRGYNKLVENSRVTSYEGQVEATRQYVFGKDFFMGDVIQMANEYGIEGNARVIEWVISISSNGYEVYPTFDAVQLIDSSVSDEEDEE